jgi:hypothetical protein
VKLPQTLAHRSAGHLTRVAAVVALLGLAIMAYSTVVPRPLPVILAMSLGHVLGAVAVLFYVLAILLQMARKYPAVEAETRTETGVESDTGTETEAETETESETDTGTGTEPPERGASAT